MNKKANFPIEVIDSAPTGSSAIIDYMSAYNNIKPAFDELSDRYAELQEKHIEVKRKLKTKEALDALIEPYANRAYGFMCAYCGVVGLMVLFHGTKNSWFRLPETVLNFLVGSTAVTVIGLVATVLTGIFIGARSN